MTGTIAAIVLAGTVTYLLMLREYRRIPVTARDLALAEYRANLAALTAAAQTAGAAFERFARQFDHVEALLLTAFVPTRDAQRARREEGPA